MTQLVRPIRRFVPKSEGVQKLESDLAASFDFARHHEDRTYLRSLIKPDEERVIPGSFEDRLIRESIATRDVWGVNHRGFWTGGIGLVVVNGQVRLKPAANNSSVEGVQRNCTELEIEAQARMWHEELGLEDIAFAIGSVTIEWNFVAGPHEPSVIATSLGREANTLPPCDECRDVYDESPYVPPDMLFTTIAAPIRGPALQVETRTRAEIDAECANLVVPPSSEMRRMALLVGAGSLAAVNASSRSPY